MRTRMVPISKKGSLMLKISRLADYGTVVMSFIAQNGSDICNAKDIALATHLQLPTVSKLLKRLARAGLLSSQRGAKGGYQLALAANEISVADIIDAIDGHIAITECSEHQGQCALQSHCSISSNWRLISRAIYTALESVSLQDMFRNQVRAAAIKPRILESLGIEE